MLLWPGLNAFNYRNNHIFRASFVFHSLSRLRFTSNNYYINSIIFIRNVVQKSFIRIIQHSCPPHIIRIIRRASVYCATVSKVWKPRKNIVTEASPLALHDRIHRDVIYKYTRVYRRGGLKCYGVTFGQRLLYISIYLRANNRFIWSSHHCLDFLRTIWRIRIASSRRQWKGRG